MPAAAAGGGASGGDLQQPGCGATTHAAAALWKPAASTAGTPASEWESAAKLLSLLPMLAALRRSI